jgi:1-acyl-sn-glycerol-3-phosphate acyltransferase
MSLSNNITSNKQIEKNIIFRFFYFINFFIKRYYNIKLKNVENIPTHNKSVIYISRHSTHNWDIFPGMFLFYNYYKKPIRGIGYKLINLTLPHYKHCGIVIGNRDNVNKLINNDEIIYILPGGAEESTIGHENSYKINWITKSGNYRTGFAKIAIERNIEIIPVAGENTEEMVFAPIIYLANLLYITKYYDYLLKIPGSIGLMFFYIKLILTCVFGTLFVIPIPVPVTLHIGAPLKLNNDESLLDFTKRCEFELQKIYLNINNKSYKKNILSALSKRFI